MVVTDRRAVQSLSGNWYGGIGPVGLEQVNAEVEVECSPWLQPYSKLWGRATCPGGLSGLLTGSLQQSRELDILTIQCISAIGVPYT